MKTSYDIEADMMDFREILIDHMRENYPDVRLSEEAIERRCRLAAETYENPTVSITRAMDEAMDVLLDGYEFSGADLAETLFEDERPGAMTDYMKTKLTRDVLALCALEFEKSALSDRPGDSEECRILKNKILPMIDNSLHIQ